MSLYDLSRSLWLVACGTLIAASLAGCGGASAGSVVDGSLVSGLVRLDGKPVVGAQVRLIPEGSTKGYGGIGVTSDSGEYLIEGPSGAEKLPEGKYKVVVQTFQPPEDPDLAAKFAAPSGQPTTIPRKYTEEGSTPLTAIVRADGKSIDFELKSK